MGWFDENAPLGVWDRETFQTLGGVPGAGPTEPSVPIEESEGYKAIADAYRKYYGRTPGREEVLERLGGMPRSAADPVVQRQVDAIARDKNQINTARGSTTLDEAVAQGRAAYAASGAPTGASGGGGGTPGAPLDEEGFRSWFFSVTGEKLTTDQLAALEPEITARGWKVQRNASGRATKLVGPDGSIYDPIEDDDPGGKNLRVWNRASGPGGAALGGGQASGGGQVGSLLEPWTVPFEYPSYTPPPAFQAPTADEAFNDQGFQFTLQQGQKALERSAAARGTLLTTGTLQELNQFTQGAASQQYDKVYGRKLGEHQYQGGTERGDYARDYDKALGEFRQGYDIWAANQDRPFSKLSTLAGFGQVGSQSLLGAGQGYAGQYGNTVMGNAANLGNLWGAGANAQAAGQVGSANAWNQAFGNLANMGQYYAGLYSNPWGGNNFSRQGPYAGGYRF